MDITNGSCKEMDGIIPQLNNETINDRFLLPRIDNILYNLFGSALFSTLDMKSGYCQVEMAPEDQGKTTFLIGSGLRQFTVMLFVLCNE